MTQLRCGSATDVGLVRRNNQDQRLCTDTLFAVADGMGGHVGGEVASAAAIEALRESFAGDGNANAHHSSEDLMAAVRQANARVFKRAMDEPELRGMGTTLTAAALVVDDDEDRIAIANVGDSRAYVFAHNELTQLTEDHSIPEELVRQGQLDPSEVDSHPQRHILTRAIGIQADVDVDLWEVLPVTGDRIVLCSDGLVREVTDDQIASVLRRLADPTEAAQELVARARSHGGSDNITVIVIDVVDDGGLAEQASATLAPSAVESRVVEHPEPENDGATFGTAEATSPEEADEEVAPKRRRLTLRLVLFVVVVLAVIAGAVTAVVAYARGSYYVIYGAAGAATFPPFTDSSSRPILVYQGRPGGLLWFDPTLVERTPYFSNEVCPSRTQDLLHGHLVSSKSAADKYVQNLITEAQQICGTR
jgi:protein phosphatase